jgi:hypothetical protein
MTDEKTIFLFAKDDEVCGSVVSEGNNLVYIRPIASSSGQDTVGERLISAGHRTC